MQGLEEAAEKKDARAEREEQAELQAAARERMKRQSNTGSGVQAGLDPINRKVKVLLLGDSGECYVWPLRTDLLPCLTTNVAYIRAGVGKSSIIQRYISDTFNPSLVSTLGVDLKTKRVHVDDKVIQVQVWDTAGQAAFHKITTSYYKGSNAILLVYDISDRRTFTNIEYWVKSIKEKASPDVQVALIGNKMDMRSVAGSDCVAFAEGKKAADKYKVMYVETSAMTSGVEVGDAFQKIVLKVLALDPKFATDGNRSPEATSIFTKNKGEKKAGEKGTEKPEGLSSPGTSPDPDGKKKDCVIS